MCERNVTPPPSYRRRPARENTWNPPESVRIGPLQPMKRCSPPTRSMTSTPGRSKRW